MKIIKLLTSLLLLLAFSCALSKKPEPVPSPTPTPESKYTPHDIIVDKFSKFEEKQMGMFEERLNRGAALRLLDIPKEDVFFSGIKIKRIKDQQMDFRGVSSSDLREFDTPVISQWNGTCTAHGLAAGMENVLKGKVNLSERHVWSRYKQYSCAAAIKAWDNGQACVTESTKWPNSNLKPYVGYLDKQYCHSYLLKTKYIDNDLNKMIENLESGMPVYIGISVTKSMLNCDAVLNPSSQITGGGHALSIVGHALSSKVPGGGYFIVKNSWGSDCGDKGYQYLPFSHCSKRSDMYCIMWSIVSVK